VNLPELNNEEMNKVRRRLTELLRQEINPTLEECQALEEADVHVSIQFELKIL
jgi:hypothetical protein